MAGEWTPDRPRLVSLVLVGVAGLALGAIVGALGYPMWGLRVGVLGFLLTTFGVASYVAVGVFERRPGT